MSNDDGIREFLRASAPPEADVDRAWARVAARRGSHGHRPLVVLAVAAATVILVIGSIALFASLRGEQDPTTPSTSIPATSTSTTSSSTSTSTTEATTTTATPEDQALTFGLGDLEPGRYATSRFAIPFEIEVPPGWEGTFDRAEDVIIGQGVGPTTPSFARQVAFISIRDDRDHLAVAEDILAEDILDITSSEPAIVGGRPAIRIEATSLTEQLQALFSLAPSNDGYGVEAGYRNVFWVVDVDGRTLVISLDAPIEDFDAFSSSAETLVASITFTG